MSDVGNGEHVGGILQHDLKMSSRDGEIEAQTTLARLALQRGLFPPAVEAQNLQLRDAIDAQTRRGEVSDKSLPRG
jgi:hypothetical protein